MRLVEPLQMRNSFLLLIEALALRVVGVIARHRDYMSTPEKVIVRGVSRGVLETSQLSAIV